MYQSDIARRPVATSPDRNRAFAALFAGAVLLIALSLLVRPVNHDEGQYVGAIAMMRLGWPYRDFAYLQTPLQPLLLAPLAWLNAGWLYLAVRLANALLGLGTLALTAWALRGRASQRATLLTMAALTCTNIFLFAASEARNDALPMCLLAAAIALHLRAIDGRREVVTLGIAGLLYGLAASAKISFAIPAAAAVLHVLLDARGSRNSALAFLAGTAAGLLPSLAGLLLAPREFGFDVFGYSLEAPRQYWTAVGQAYRLHPWIKLRDLALLAIAGPIGVALAMAAMDRRSRPRQRFLLDLLIVAGLISAYLPDPSFPQYWVPVLPPLFVRLGISLDHLRSSRRRIATALLTLACFAGVAPTMILAAQATVQGSSLVGAIRDGGAAARLARGGRIVSLAPEIVAGADSNFDQRFATGPFLFRTFGPLADQARLRGNAVTWQRLEAALDREPPALIVVGTETKPSPLFPRGMDAGLADWALAHDYVAMRSPSRSLVYWARPLSVRS